MHDAEIVSDSSSADQTISPASDGDGKSLNDEMREYVASLEQTPSEPEGASPTPENQVAPGEPDQIKPAEDQAAKQSRSGVEKAIARVTKKYHDERRARENLELENKRITKAYEMMAREYEQVSSQVRRDPRDEEIRRLKLEKEVFSFNSELDKYRQEMQAKYEHELAIENATHQILDQWRAVLSKYPDVKPEQFSTALAAFPDRDPEEIAQTISSFGNARKPIAPKTVSRTSNVNAQQDFSANRDGMKAYLESIGLA